MCVAPIQESCGVVPTPTLPVNKQINVFCFVGKGKVTIEGDDICVDGKEGIQIRIPRPQDLVYGDKVDVKLTITFADGRPPLVFDDLDFTLNEEDKDDYDNFDFESFEFVQDDGQYGGYYKPIDNAFNFEDAEYLLILHASM